MLGGFTKVYVPASGSLQVSLSMPYADLAYWDPLSSGTGMVLEAGDYTAFVCAHSADCPAEQSHSFAIPRTVINL